MKFIVGLLIVMSSLYAGASQYAYYNMSAAGAINSNSLNLKKIGKITYDRCSYGKCYFKYIYIMSYKDTKHSTNNATCKAETDCDSYSKLIDTQQEAIIESWAKAGSETKIL